MSAIQTRNVEYLLIGKNAGDAPAANEEISQLAEGEIGIFSPTGKRLSTASAEDSFKLILMGASGKPAFVSEAINSGVVEAISTKAGASAKQQIDSVGFDGSSGSLDAMASNDYAVTMYIQEFLTSNTDGRYIKHFQFSSSDPVTQQEVARELLKSAILNFSKEAENYLLFEMLMAVNDVALNAAVTFITFTNKSKTAKATNATTGLAVGDYLRIGTTGSDEVYRIEAISGLNLTLNVPFQGSSAVVANAGLMQITSAIANGLACGILMTGRPLQVSVGKLFYKQARWEFSLKNFGSTASKRVQGADKGVGTFEEISQLEHFLKGFEGETYRMGEPAIFRFNPLSVKADANYDITTIRWNDSHLVGFQNNVSPKQITLATTDALGVNTYMNHGVAGVWAVLSAFTGLTVTAV